MAQEETAQPKPAATAAAGKSQVARPPQPAPTQTKPSPHKEEGTGAEARQPRDAREPADGRLRVSPVARRLADEHGIDLRSIEGTGPAGRVIKRDVLKAVDAAEETAAAAVPPATQQREIARAAPQEVQATRVPLTAKPAAEGPTTILAGRLEHQIVPLSSIRQTIAKRLIESKTTIPHYQVSLTFDMDPLLSLRSTLNEQLAPHGVKLSVNDFLVRCCALAMYQHPEFNSSWGGDHIEIHGEINIGIAISLPRERGGGLVVATIRNADHKSLRIISQESKALAEKARTRGLTIQEMSDSTFTISNLGMFGVDNFNAIINPPNSAILAVGAAVERPVVRNHQLTVGHEMSATVSCDHRVIDGAMAAEYLQTLKQLIENPGTLLV